MNQQTPESLLMILSSVTRGNAGYGLGNAQHMDTVLSRQAVENQGKGNL